MGNQPLATPLIRSSNSRPQGQCMAFPFSKPGILRSAYRPKFKGGLGAGPSGVTYAYNVSYEYYNNHKGVIVLTFVMPPSTTKSVPLTKLLSSLARNTTAWACSIASPNRPVGKCISRRRRLALSSPSQSWRRGVLWSDQLDALDSSLLRGLLQWRWTQSIEAVSLSRVDNRQLPGHCQYCSLACGIGELRSSTAYESYDTRSIDDASSRLFVLS